MEIVYAFNNLLLASRQICGLYCVSLIADIASRVSPPKQYTRESYQINNTFCGCAKLFPAN